MKQQYSTISLLYVFSILVFEVFYVDNAYFNIMEAKSGMLQLITAVFLVLFLGVTVSYAAKDAQGFDRNLKRKLKDFNLVDIAAVALALSSVVSCLFSDNKSAALLGSRGWGAGAWMYIFLVLLYFFVSRSYSVTPVFVFTMLLSGSIVFIWSLLNVCSVDFFGMHERIYGGKTAAMAYLASIGNSNSMAGYASMLIPAVGILFIDSKKTVSKIVYGIFLLLGFACCIAANCDGVYLGLAIGILCMTIFAAGSLKRIRLLFASGAIFCASICLIKLLRLISGTEKFVDLTGISAKLCSTNLAIILLIVFFTIYIALCFAKNANLARFAAPLRISAAALFIAAVIVVIVYASRGFDDNWGSYRGYIWRRSAEMFGELDFKSKLFGIGSDCFGILFSTDPKATLPGAIVLNAHNEWLQYLITTGIIGVAAYAFFWAAPAVDALFIKKRISAPKAAMLAGIAGYMGQAVVNNPQPLCMCILFLFLALYRAQSDSFELADSFELDTANIPASNN